MPPIAPDEIARNFAAFQALLPTIIAERRGQFALMHAERVEQYFAGEVDAVREGVRRYGWERFSVQEVTDEVEDLGFYSYVGGGVLA